MSGMKLLSALSALVASIGLTTAASAPHISRTRTPSHDSPEEFVGAFGNYNQNPSCGKGMVFQQHVGDEVQDRQCVYVEVLYKGERVEYKGDEPLIGSVGGKSLADTLTLDRRGRVWWDYAREVDSVTSRLMTIGQSTLLVPTDSAIMKLARKPHQNQEGQTSDDEAEKNVERFLAAHIIPDFNQPKTDGPVKNLLGTEIEIVETETGSYIVKPGDIEVVELSQASNGRILYLDGVLPFRE